MPQALDARLQGEVKAGSRGQAEHEHTTIYHDIARYSTMYHQGTRAAVGDGLLQAPGLEFIMLGRKPS